MVKTKKAKILMSEPKVLLLSPSFKLNGGVVEFNKMLLKFSKSNLILFEFQSGLKKSKVGKLNSLIVDYVCFIFTLWHKSIDIVHVNPSLGKNSILRDGNYIRIAKFFNKKVFVHWHGWNPDNDYLLQGKHVEFLKKTFFKADHIKFLSNQFAEQFKSIGFENKITVGNTFIDDKLLTESLNKTSNPRKLKLLFLSTISKNKGIYLALEAFRLASQVCSDIEFTVAGTGAELEGAKKFVLENKVENVCFIGHVKDYEKIKVYSESDVYLFPSSYEGMPTSLLEAMGFGLAIICSNVGAIPEIFIQHKMGKMISTFNVEDYSDVIIQFVKNKEMIEMISDFNLNYAKKHFLASETIAKIDADYIKILK
jgi:glycosyltransferase involved in cell wall biosynthesis